MAERTISFARGAPSADILPHEAVREAAARALESDWEKALSYGTGIGPSRASASGSPSCTAVEPDQVMVTNGSMEAAALLFRHLVAPGDRVIVEQPTYDRTLLLLAAGRRRARRRCRSRPTASTSTAVEAALRRRAR